MTDARLLGAFGVLGCVVFAVVVAALTAVQWTFLQGRGWDPIRSTDVPYPSTLALGPVGSLQVLNFAILGLALLAVAAGLWQALEPRPTAPIALLAVAGVAGVALMAVTDGSLTSVRTWHGAVHVVAFFVLLIAVVLAAVSVAFSVGDVPTWAWLRLPSVTVAVAVVVLTAITFTVPAVGGLASVLSILAMLGWVGLVGLALASS